MRLPFRRRASRRLRPPSPIQSSVLLASLLTPLSADALSFTAAPPANLDLSQLGRVGIAGDFSGISLYQFLGQSERPFSTNGSESLLGQLPNGDFVPLVSTDASIQTMCTFTLQNGNMAGVVLGGNFTSLNSNPSQAIAMFNPNTSQVVPLAGLSGQVNALLCDQETNTVYVGGNFRGADSTNAIAWFGTSGWTSLPFAGFNGPVTSITKASNGHIIFGGSFTGVGNASTPSQRDGQIINLSTAQISAGSSTTTAGFSDPRNIICKTSGADGSGNTWLLQDNTPGFWSAKFNFGFRPTKIRLWNTRQGGRGTRTWRFTALPINGIMNLTYIDPATGQNMSCTNQCPLSNDPAVPFQDFRFVNVIGMNEFRVDISDWFGSGGGLNGIELFEDDIFAYAINEFNEPTCASISTPSTATTTGPWTVAPANGSVSQYLTAQLSGTVSASSAAVTFFPDIKESGSYSVNMYTPGCVPDNTCATRAQVSITGSMAPNVNFSTSLYQTNNFDKYDQIYFGFIAASTSSFRPSVTMTPLAGQNLNGMTFVAQRVGFTLLNSTGGLTGLFDFDPTQAVVNSSEFSSSPFNRFGSGFTSLSAVSALATSGDVVYIAGNFTSDAASNIAAINSRSGTAQPLDGGLNGEVNGMYLNGTSLYVGGRFSNTVATQTAGLNNVAVYDTGRNVWNPLGAGVNGPVRKVVPLKLRIAGKAPETVISFTGDFSEILATGNSPAVPAAGFAVWVPSLRSWLPNVNVPAPSVNGVLSTAILELPGGGSLLAGSVTSSQIGANGAATLSDALSRFPVQIQPIPGPSNPLTRRETDLQRGNVSGVIAGAFYEEGGRNVTILAGHFTATATNGSAVHNLVFINGANSDAVSGLGPEISNDSTFVALAIKGDTLFAGGRVSGNVNGRPVGGLISYNLASSSLNVQPPALTGGNGTVAAIAVRPNSEEIFVGGSFDMAGALACPGVCLFNRALSQWNRPGANLDGDANTMVWTSETVLVAGGSFTVNGTSRTFLATFDTTRSTWDSFPGSSDLPGPVESMTLASADGKQLWVTGTSSTGAVFLMKYDGTRWQASGQTLGAGTRIRSLQVFTLTSGHGNTDLVPSNRALLLTGSIDIPGYGTASAALFNGTSLQPYALTTNFGNTAGTVSRIFTQNDDFFASSGGRMPVGFVVLIGLAISLGLMFLIVLAGLFLDRLRKKREGYIPAPTSMFDRGSGLQRLPPQELLREFGKGKAGVPHV